MSRRCYTFTEMAAQDVNEIAEQSREKWGKRVANAYLDDLEEGAAYIANNHWGLAKREHLTAGSHLSAYPVREHYIIYHAAADDHIVIVAVLAQERDIPRYLYRNSLAIGQELDAITQKIERGEIMIK